MSGSPMNGAKYRRCRCFDGDGNPLKGGCPRSARACHFAHPEDSEWDKLAEGPGYKRNREAWNEERSPVRRRNSSFYDRRRSPSPSSHRGRRDSAASTSFSGSHDTRSAMNIDEAFEPEPTEQDEVKPIISRTGSVTDSLTQRPVLQPIVTTSPVPANPDHPPSAPSATYLPQTPSSAMALASSSSIAMPPPNDPPVPPPPPLPVVPELNPTLETPEVLDPESQAKSEIWETRIKRLVDSAIAQENLLQAEDDLAKALSITQAPYFSALHDDVKQRAQTEIAQLQTRRDELQRAVDESIEKLVGSDSWPPPLEKNNESEEKKDGYEEVAKYVEELKSITAEMSKVLGDMSGLKPPPTSILTVQDADQGVPMDVDDGAVRPPPPSSGGGAGGDMPTHAELEWLLDKVVDLEGALSNIRNDLDAKYDEFDERMDELKATLEQEAAGGDGAAGGGESGPAEGGGSIMAEDDDAEEAEEGEVSSGGDGIRADIDILIKENKQAGDDIGELSGYITDQINQGSALATQLAQARAESAQTLERFQMLQSRFNEYAQAREKDTQTLRVLDAALKAYTSSSTAPPSPPASPAPSFPVSSDYILQALEEPITDTLRDKMKPLIQEFRDSVTGLLKEQNAEVYSTVWEKVKGTLFLLKAISDKLEVPGGGGELMVNPSAMVGVL